MAALTDPKTGWFWDAQLMEDGRSVRVGYGSFAAPKDIGQQTWSFATAAEAQAFVKGAEAALEARGMRSGKGRAAPSRRHGLPRRFETAGRLRQRLQDGSLEGYAGRLSQDTLLSISIALASPEQARDALKDMPHLDDYLRRKPWPESYVPFAWLEPQSDEDERLWQDANPSDCEQFFVADLSCEPCPVYLWSHDAGFERVAEGLDDFLDGLLPRRS